jgi:hypothetical protein
MKQILILLACSLVGSAFAVPTGKSVSGRVLDRDDAAVVGVRVQAYREQRAIGNPVDSDKSGSYQIDFPDGKPLDSIRYDHSDWFPAVVEDISGKNSHTIYKTLLKRGKNLTTFDADAVVCDFERLAYLDKNNGMLEKNAEQYHYREALEEIESLPLPNEMKDRIKAIKQKYGIR